MRKPLLLALLAALLLGAATSAEAKPDLSTAPAPDVVVSGRVTDEETGEALIGASVYADSLAGGVTRGAATNAYGYYSVSVPAGRARVRVSYVGYSTQLFRLEIGADARMDIALSPNEQLGSVTVTAAADEVTRRPEDTPQMGVTAISGADVRALPALFGESDVLKAVQLLPGVRGGTEGTAGIYVRGGSPDQTLILLDGSPVYNAGHLFGFVSTFNGDAVNAVELTRGAYPARFGGRLAAVLDVRLRDGDFDTYRATGQIGILTSRLLVEGPIVPGRASFLLSGRRTYMDVIARPFINAANEEARANGNEQVFPDAYFQDLNAKVNWRVTDGDRFYLSLYGGGDTFAFRTVREQRDCLDTPSNPFPVCTPTNIEDRSNGGLDWGNLTGSARWTRALSTRAFGDLTLTASDYNFNVGAGFENGVNGPNAESAIVKYRSGIRDLAVRGNVDLLAGRSHSVRFGGSATLHRFSPGALSVLGTGELAIDTLLGATITRGVDAVLYAEDEWKLTPKITVAPGLHTALYVVEGEMYPSVEPRFSIGWNVLSRLALKASAAVTQQPLHLLSSGGLGLPADLWVPATPIAPPERGWQVAFGAAGSTPSGATTWTLETYWREMRGLISYKDGVAFSTPAEDWQNLVVRGDGRSIGAELFVQHRTDRLTAWLGYTLAKTDRRFDALNAGARFPYRYDRRHDVSIVALYQLSRKFDISAAAVYGTGDAVTLPIATIAEPPNSGNSPFEWRDPFGVYGGYNGGETSAYGPKNGFRLPAYARVDLGLTMFFRRGARPHALALNIYNVTNRKNPFITTVESEYDESTGRERTGLRGLTLFPIIPTLSYQFSV